MFTEKYMNIEHSESTRSSHQLSFIPPTLQCLLIELYLNLILKII